MTDERSLWRYVLRSLWGPLLVVVAVGMVWATVRWVPLVEVEAICWEGEGYHPIAGALGGEFRDALRDELTGIAYYVNGRETLIPLWVALDIAEVGFASEDAIWTVVTRRTGISKGQLARGVRIAGFRNDGVPTCEAVQAIAIWDGVWAREGPAPIWRRPSPGVPAPDYSREGDLPPVEKWGLALPHFTIAAGILLLVGLGLGIYGGHRVEGWKGAARPRRYRRWGGFLGFVLTLTAMILPAIIW